MTAASAQTRQDNALERCREFVDEAAQLRCFRAASKPAITTPQAALRPAAAGTWRLVRTPNPAGGKDAVSIMQTADIAKSDLGLAGLMVRCGESGPEVLVVLVTPLPPRAHPQVTLSAGATSANFDGTVVSPGAAVLLPPQATLLASAAAKADPELAVRLDTDGQQIKGVVSLSGLDTALSLLPASCPPQ